MNNLKKVNNAINRKGFTLIELLVVIAIIALLSSVVLTSLGTSRMRGEIAKVVGDYRSVANSLELYRQANAGQYPGTAGTAITVASLVSGALSPYIKQSPSISSAVVVSSLPNVYYWLNSPVVTRYWCENTSTNQDYVISFTPTSQAANSELFKPVYVADTPNPTVVPNTVCIPTFQR